jgi:hypothetical protein
MRSDLPRGLVIFAAVAAVAGGWALASWLVRPGAEPQREHAAERAALREGAADAAPDPSHPTLPPPEPLESPEAVAPAGRSAPDREVDAGEASPSRTASRAWTTSSKPIPPPGAGLADWAAAIERQREARNSVGLHALIDALPRGTAGGDAAGGAAARDAGGAGGDAARRVRLPPHHALGESAAIAGSERVRLLALATSALAAVGVDPRTDPDMRANARRAFDDLLAAPTRDVRLAAINAFALAYPDERDAILHELESDPDPVIRAKAQALLAALR